MLKKVTLLSFYLSRARTQYSFISDSRFLYEVKHMVCASKGVCVRFSIFNSVLFLSKFLPYKKHGLFDYKMS